MLTATPANIYEFITDEVNSRSGIAVALDPHLNYLAVNQEACAHLRKHSNELLGNSILDLFPSIIASKNHRNLLRAASGETILNDTIETVNGVNFFATYDPLIIDRQVRAVFVTARPADQF